MDERSSGEEEYIQGNELFKEGKFAQSIPFFEAATKQGFYAAHLRLGRIFRDGDMNLPRNKTKSEKLFKRIYGRLEWFQSRAESQSPDDLFNLGIFYNYDLGHRDDRLAVKYYQLAADQGYAMAQTNLANCLRDGDGITADGPKALEYYQLAADQGEIRAQYIIGLCCGRQEYTKFGLPQDPEKSLKYTRLAADVGNYAPAQYNLAICYEQGDIGLTADFNLARKYYELASDQGLSLSHFRLGSLYIIGRGFEKNPEAAFKYFKLSADQMDPDALEMVAHCYREGVGVEQDAILASEYTQLAADHKISFPEEFLGKSGVGFSVG